jgi:MoaA/NifB/PqqE/SkfB family radical SAM enzyme
MYFNALVIEITTKCNARCAMCYQGAGPKGSDRWGAVSLTTDEVARVVREAAGIETLRRRFHLSGGEAFLNFDDCVGLLQLARSYGFTELSCTTNAFWSRTRDCALSSAVRLRAAGVTNIEVSWDEWHAPFIRPEAINNCLIACSEVGIETTLRILSSRRHSLEKALAALSPEAIDSVWRITCGPVFPSGRAGRELDREDFYRFSGDVGGSCHSYLNLTVNQRGDVFPCCAGMDQTDLYRFGNIREESIASIAAAMNRSYMLRTIVFQGIGALDLILRAVGIELNSEYANICHKCWSVFSDEYAVRAIVAHFREMERAAVLEAIEVLHRE